LDAPATPPRVPSLAALCVRALLDCYVAEGADFAAAVLPLLSAHARREMLRYSAVHAPLAGTCCIRSLSPRATPQATSSWWVRRPHCGASFFSHGHGHDCRVVGYV